MDPDLYISLSNASFELARQGALPLQPILAGTRYERAVTPGPWYRGPHSVLTLPANAKTTDENRWSGRSYDGRPGNAGFYMGPWNAVRAEVWHHGARKDDPSISDAPSLDQKAFKDKLIFELNLLQRIDLVDIRALSSRIAQNQDVRRFLQHHPRNGTLWDWVLDPHDYTASRAIVDGIFRADVGYRGLQVPTARSYLGVSGENTVLIDSPSRPMTTVPLEVIKVSRLSHPPIRGDNFVGTFTGEYLGLSREERLAEFKAKLSRGGGHV
ncbi:hypothetical protein WME95_50540 [Sorangium sp. So ce327]|uniref:hypothetical protein n=1 Tax=Sorangium sp. So ce327 TaxID=3133301 RepID=UPI003F605B78